MTGLSLREIYLREDSSWHYTKKQVERLGKGPFVGGRPWKFKLVPVSKIEYISFSDEEFEEEARDPKGGPEYVKSLAKLMAAGKDMDPAVGYVFGGYYVAHDGNHRIAAAKLLGIREIPMVVYETGSLHESYSYKRQIYSDNNGEYRVLNIIKWAKQNAPLKNFDVDNLAKIAFMRSKEENFDEVPGSPEFVKRAEESDLAYPIVVVRYPDGDFIADGNHRLWKARALGMKKIKGYLLSQEDLKATRKDLKEAYYHGTTVDLQPGDLVLPPSETGKIAEKGRKKHLDKVFFTQDLNSAKIYAGRTRYTFGGEPRLYEVEPIGKIEPIQMKPGTTVMMAPRAKVIKRISLV